MKDGGIAGGERLLDHLTLTKGLRHHYATPASGAQNDDFGPKEGCYSPSLWPKGKTEIRHMPPKIPPKIRAGRLAAALRENLKRRKSRRARRAAESAEPAAEN